MIVYAYLNMYIYMLYKLAQSNRIKLHIEKGKGAHSENKNVEIKRIDLGLMNFPFSNEN